MSSVVRRPSLLLRYVERSRVPLDETAAEAGWLDLIRFLFDPDTTDQFTLHALLSHPYYRDDYLVPNSPCTPGVTRHGPYLLDCLGADSFELIDRQTAEETLHHWVDESGRFAERRYPASIHTAERILVAATTIFYLKDLRGICEHESGGALAEFHEFVLLNRHDGILTVLVASTTH